MLFKFLVCLAKQLTDLALVQTCADVVGDGAQNDVALKLKKVLGGGRVFVFRLGRISIVGWSWKLATSFGRGFARILHRC